MNLTRKYSKEELEFQSLEIAIQIQTLSESLVDGDNFVELEMLRVDEESFINGEEKESETTYYDNGRCIFIEENYYSNGKKVTHSVSVRTNKIINKRFYMILELSQLDKVKLIKDLSQKLVDIQNNIMNFEVYRLAPEIDDKAVMKNATQKM